MWSPNSRVQALAALAGVLVTAAIALIFFYVPTDADQGISQKIFYFHVPIALTAYACFGWGALKALLHLWKRRPGADLESYVAIHMGVIFGALTLATGSIWARASWGHWWVWNEPTLVSFLIVTLLYACYQPLRFSIEDRERQARYASVFAVVAGAFVPMNFLAVRLAQAYSHPRVFATANGGLPPKMQLTFYVCLLGMVLLFITLWRYEMAAKRARGKLRALKRRLGGEEVLIGRSAAPTV